MSRADSARLPQHLWSLTSAAETEVPDFGAANNPPGCSHCLFDLCSLGPNVCVTLPFISNFVDVQSPKRRDRFEQAQTQPMAPTRRLGEQGYEHLRGYI